MNKEVNNRSSCLLVIIIGIIVSLMSCSKEPKKADDQPTVVEEHSITPVEVQLADSIRRDTLSQTKTKEAGNASRQTIVNTYDEGYLDGEAMAEEDKLAGKPGMQVGMDDDEDDDDYEDGFDDGYEE